MGEYTSNAEAESNERKVELRNIILNTMTSFLYMYVETVNPRHNVGLQDMKGWWSGRAGGKE